VLAALLTAGCTGLASAAEPDPVPSGDPASPAASVSAEPVDPGADVPQLTIAIDDGRDSAAAGDQVTYAVTVTNLGSTPVEGLSVSQRLPAGGTFSSADHDGQLRGDAVVWTVDVPASGEFTASSVMTVGETAPDELRLAGVVCAALAADQPPLVCASDTDELPAGARAAAASTAASAASTAPAGGGSAQDGPRWWWFAAGAGVLVVVVGAVLLVVLRRRRRKGAAHRGEQVDAGVPVG
jgi:uncharacterized repeat protein (TIGR01451 family)